MDIKFLGNYRNQNQGLRGSVYGCGGGHTPKILEVRKIGIIACFAMDGSQNFGLKPNRGGYSKTLKANTHDIAILERVWKSEKS